MVSSMWLDFLTTWWPQGELTCNMAAQGSECECCGKQDKMEFPLMTQKGSRQREFFTGG